MRPVDRGEASALSRRVRAALCAIGLLLGLSPLAGATPLGVNVIVNPGAEAGAGAADFGTTTAPLGWATTSNFSAVQYAAGGASDLNAADSAAIGGGVNYFAGGPSNALATAVQTILFSDLASAVDAGALSFLFSGYLGGFDSQADNLRVDAIFRNAANAILFVSSLGPVTNAQRGNVSQLLFRSNGSQLVPLGARSVDILLTATRFEGSYNDGYADNLSLQFNSSATPPVVPEPATVLLLGAGALACGRRIASRDRSRRA